MPSYVDGDTTACEALTEFIEWRHTKYVCIFHHEIHQIETVGDNLKIISENSYFIIFQKKSDMIDDAIHWH